MPLISDDYLDQMRQLHSGSDRNLAFGFQGSRWAKVVMSLREQHGCQTVLDYGCGKGALGEALGSPEWFHEYDPAIEGKDKAPKPADLVVCTDVFEHIEPEMLDDVLADIRKKMIRIGVFNIATRPAKKTLPDGRNAHLIVEQAPFWEEKVENYFNIKEWDINESSEVFFVVDNAKKLDEIITQSAVADNVRADNVAANVPRVTPRLGVLPPNRSTAVLVCYGPSLHQTWEDIRVEGGWIVTVSGAHDFLVERGVIPNAHIEADAREMKARYTAKPNEGTQYLIASCCHPKTIDQLIDQNLALWHVGTDEKSLEVLRRIEPGAIAVGGGGSVGLRAMAVLYTMGFRRFVIHGMDCSFADDGNQHAGEHFGKKQHATAVKVGEKWFNSSLVMVSYAKYFRTQVNNLNEEAKRDGEPLMDNGQYIDVRLAGTGMLQTLTAANNQLEETGT